MAEAQADKERDINTWLARVSLARTRKELFAMLDQFRLVEWTDFERSQMAKQYIRIVDELESGEENEGNTGADSGASADGAKEGEGDDGPVWYEKM